MKTFLATTATALALSTASASPSFRSLMSDADIKPLILGGTETPLGQRQFVTGLRYTPAGQSVCGGSLIHPKWVLSPAHCDVDDEGNPSKIAYVSVGTHYFQGAKDSTAIKVVRKIRHPRFRSANTGNDFLLLELEFEAPYAPVALAANPPATGVVGTTLGWGDTKEGCVWSEVLLQVDVAVQSNATCKTALTKYQEATILCAGGVKNQDACQGDSGGPLVATTADGSDALVGTTSWGRGCGQAGIPGVYARVSAVRAFIDQYVPQYSTWVHNATLVNSGFKPYDSLE